MFHDQFKLDSGVRIESNGEKVSRPAGFLKELHSALPEELTMNGLVRAVSTVASALQQCIARTVSLRGSRAWRGSLNPVSPFVSCSLSPVLGSEA